MATEVQKQIFSHNLQHLMETTKTSRNDICRDLNLKYSTVRDWEKGLSYPRPDKIEMLAKYFGLDDVYLTKSQLAFDKLVETLTDTVIKWTEREEEYRNAKLDELVEYASQLSERELDIIINIVKLQVEDHNAETP